MFVSSIILSLSDHHLYNICCVRVCLCLFAVCLSYGVFVCVHARVSLFVCICLRLFRCICLFMSVCLCLFVLVHVRSFVFVCVCVCLCVVMWKKQFFFQIVFFLQKKTSVFFFKYGININTQVEITLLWDLFSIYDTVSNYFTSLLLI